MKRTTPALLSLTKFISDVFTPSLVSISPPKASSLILSPTATFLDEDSPLEDCPFLLAVEVDDLTELVFFTGGGASVGASLRFRNSTMFAVIMSSRRETDLLVCPEGI